MPVYEYRCPVCQHEQIRMVPWIKADAQSGCPSCGPDVCLDRLPSAPNFTVQGLNAKNGYSR